MRKMSQTEELAKILATRARRHTLTPEQVSRAMDEQDYDVAELDAYAPLVTPGSYCVVFDTFVEDMPPGFFDDRPWDVGNNPKTALRQWLQTHPDFEVDASWPNKLMVTVAPEGFLRRKG